MSSITRNRSSRSGMYHSCWRSQLSCQVCQYPAPVAVSAVFAVFAITNPSIRNTLEDVSAVTGDINPQP